MAKTVFQAFAEFRAKLEPTERQREDASTKHNGVRDCLNAKLWVDTAFLSGSYARWTMIRPPSDIDLFVVLDYSKHGAEFYTAPDGSTKVLERFHSILKDCYPSTPVRKDHPAVHLDFATYGFDVVPAFHRTGGGYMILSRTRYGWTATDPKKHAETTTAYNNASGHYFIPCVKILKAWNRGKNYRRLTGFHLELECTHAWPKQQVGTEQHLITPSGYAPAIAAVLANLEGTLNWRTSDPAGLSGYIDEYLSDDARKWTRERLASSADNARVALEHERRGWMELAINRWRDALGDEFPAYG